MFWRQCREKVKVQDLGRHTSMLSNVERSTLDLGTKTLKISSRNYWDIVGWDRNLGQYGLLITNAWSQKGCAPVTEETACGREGEPAWLSIKLCTALVCSQTSWWRNFGQAWFREVLIFQKERKVKSQAFLSWGKNLWEQKWLISQTPAAYIQVGTFVQYWWQL